MKRFRYYLLTPLVLTTINAEPNTYKLKDIDIRDTLNEPDAISSQEQQFYENNIPPVSSALSSERIEKNDIEAIKPKNIFELLDRAKGVNISFIGRKHPYTISFRGSSSAIANTSFGVILDGALLSDNSSMRILEALPVDIIESIDIIRDSAALSLSPLQGFGTPNGSPNEGFIVIKTKVLNKNSGGTKISYESFDTTKSSLYYGGSYQDLYFLASFNGLKSAGKDGYFNANEGGNGFFKIGVAQNDYTVELSGFYSRYFQEIQKANLPISMFDTAHWKYQPFQNRVLNFNLSKKWSDTQITHFNASASKSSWKHDQDTNLPNNTAYFIGSQKNDSLDLKHTIKFDNHILKLGTQAIFYDSPNGELFYEGYPRKEQIYGGFIQAQHFLSEQLTLDEAIRIDKKHIDKLLNRYGSAIVATYAPNTWKVPLNNSKLSMIEDTWSDGTINGAVGLLYKLDSQNSLSGKVGYASSESIDDYKLNDGSLLKKEEHFKYELGYGFKSQFINSNLNIFYYDIKNLKDPSYQGTATAPEIVFSQYDQNRYGGELSFNGKLNSFEYLVNYAYVKADTQDNEIPHHTTSLQLAYSFYNFKTFLTSKYVSKYESNFYTKDYKYYKVGDFVIFDLSVDYYHKVSNYDAIFTIFGKNITDENYMTKIGWEDVGAIIGASYSIKF